ELVVVPNACTDGTADVVAQLAERDERIRMVPVTLSGWGRSVRAGLAAARGNILAYTNTARTDPQILPGFLSRFLESRSCLVKARRESRQAPLREIGSLLFNLEARALFGIRCQDVNGTPKIFTRELYESAAPTADGDLFDLELIAAAAGRDVPIIEI